MAELQRTIPLQRLAQIAAVVAIVLLVCFGIAGVGRDGNRALVDFDYYVAAGRCWLGGSSMYDPLAFTRELRALHYDVHDLALPYSPAFAPFALALATLPYEAARVAMWSFNLAGVALLCAVAIRLARPARPATSALLVALVAGLPCTATVLWLGQLTVWMAALTCASWCALRERRSVLAGVLLGLTSVKPQFSFLLVLWFALQRKWKLLVSAGITALVLCVYAMIALGPFEPFRAFLSGVAHYADPGHDADSLGNAHVLGLPSLLTAIGVRGLGVTPFLALAALGVVLLWRARERAQADGMLAALLTLQIALVYAHDIELVFLVPAWAWLWTRFGPAGKGAAASLVLLLVLSIPARLVTSDASGLLVHWRSFVVLALLGLLLGSVFAARPDAREDLDVATR
jgi:Glycosyltransferase family 87